MSDESQDPYKAPAADLATPLETVEGGSIEQTLAGNSSLEIGAVMSEAWQRVTGIKLIVIGGLLLIYAISLGLTFAVGGAASFAGDLEQFSLVAYFGSQLVIMLISYPILAGVVMIGLRQSVGAPVSFGMLFGYYGLVLPIIGLSLLQIIAMYAGFLLLIIPGLYLLLAFSLALPLLVEKRLGVFKSLGTSLKLVNAQFLNVFVLALVATTVLGLSAFTIVGLIWTVPWLLMIYAITYRQLAGVDIPGNELDA